ncbi:MAG: hypothetical protein RhofKO_04120 [Rhodothermales bacterium]
MLRLGTTLLIGFAVLNFAQSAHAQEGDGDLDTAFGTNGLVSFSLPGISSLSDGSGVLQPDGKAVSCGYGRNNASRTNPVFARFKVDGLLDTGFATNGVFELDNATTMAVWGCALQADGKILATGATADTNVPLLVIRLNANGTLDTSFSDDGIAILASPQSTMLGRYVLATPDGTILVSGDYGSGTQQPFLARLTSAGALDTTFGTNGFVFESPGARRVRGLQRDSSGRLWMLAEGGLNAEIYRYTSNGARDTAFDTDGLVVQQVVTNGSLALGGLVFDSQGRLLISGRHINNSSQALIVLRRLTTSGQFDETFTPVNLAFSTLLSNPPGGSNAEVSPVTVDARDQPIIVGGNQAVGPGVVVRFTTSGALDTRFGDFGKRVILDAANTDSRNFKHIAVRPTGEIVAFRFVFNRYQILQLRARHPTRPDLDVTLLPAVAAVGPGASGTFRAVLRNRGWGSSSNVTVQVGPPSGFSYVSHTGSGSYDQETSTWTVGTLADEQSTTLNLTLKRTSAAAVTWTAEVKTQAETDYDSTPGNGVTTEDDYDALPLPTFKFGGGQALALDGDGDYTTYALPEAFIHTLTMEAWVRFNSFPAGGATVIAAKNVFGNRAVLRTGGTGFANNQVRFGEVQGTFEVAGPALEAGRWYHLAGTFDNRTKRLYVDGVLVGTNTDGNSGLQTGPYELGRLDDASYLNGQVDEVRIWSIARTQAEIHAAMYQSISQPPSTLTHYWTFDEASGVAHDLGASSTDATLVGNATRTDSTVPKAGTAVHIASTTAVPLGAAGQRLTVTLSGSPSASNHLGLYQSGGDARVTGETLPGDVVSRSGIVWGARELGTVTAVMVFDFSGLTAINKSTARLLKRDAPTANWTDISNTCTYNSGASTFTCSDVTTFSEFTIGEAETALPVELTAFEAISNGAQVYLRWTTASETNNAGFEVQHAITADRWTALGFVDGHGTTLDAQQYAYILDDLPPGPHRFRLKQVDFNGAFAYSPEVEVTVATPGIFALHAPFPHPATGRATLTLTTAQTERVTVMVFDLLGRAVQAVAEDTYLAGQLHRLTVDATTLPSGVYVIRAATSDAVKTQRFVVAR